MENDLKWYILSMTFMVNVGMILLIALLGGARSWTAPQWGRYGFLASLLGYLAYGPIGAVRDGNIFRDRHWCLMIISIVGFFVLLWSAIAEERRGGERVSNNSPEPGTPQTPYKAYAATAVSFVGTFVTFWVADTDPFTGKEIAQALVTAAVSSGITGGAAYQVRNAAKRVRRQ